MLVRDDVDAPRLGGRAAEIRGRRSSARRSEESDVFDHFCVANETATGWRVTIDEGGAAERAPAGSGPGSGSAGISRREQGARGSQCGHHSARRVRAFAGETSAEDLRHVRLGAKPNFPGPPNVTRRRIDGLEMLTFVRRNARVRKTADARMLGEAARARSVVPLR